MTTTTQSPVETAEEFLTKEARQQLATLLFAPSGACVRVIEAVSLVDDLPVRKTVKEYVGLAGRVLVPIAFVERGRFIDHLRIEQSNQTRGYTLSHELTVVAVRMVLADACEATTMPSDIRMEVQRACEQIAVETPASALALVDKVRTLLKSVSPTGALKQDQVNLIGALLQCARRQPLLVPCVAEEFVLKVSFERDLPFVGMQRPGLREAVRGAIGRAPNDLTFDAPLAIRTQRYHFQLRAPSDYFVREVSVRRKLRSGVRHGAGREWADTAPMDKAEVIRGAKPNPTELAHLHITGAANVAEARFGLLIRVSLAERPLGRNGAALVRIAAVLGATILVMIYGSRLVVSTNATIASLLIGAPALLGATLVGTRTTARIRDALLARFFSVLAAVGSLCAALSLTVWAVRAATYRADHSAITHFYEYRMPTSVFVALALDVSILVIAGLSVVVNVTQNVLRYRRAARSFRS